jgi:hypothetical protein
MKRIILAIGVILIAAASASAITSGPGGYIYWNKTDTTPGSPITKQLLYRAQFDTTYTQVGGTLNFDNVAVINTYGSWGSAMRHHALEVFDPRAGGGQGTLLVATVVNNTPPVGGYTGFSWQQPWDVIQVNPTTKSHTLLVDGRLNPGDGTWDSRQMMVAMTAPKNWVPGTTSNNISIVTVRGIWSGNACYLYDTNNNGQIDNSITEGKMYSDGNSPMADTELGGDKALYASYYTAAGGNTYMTIDRTWVKASGGTTTKYLDASLTRLTGPFGGQSNGMGLAVDTRPSASPIVYALTMDNNAGVSHLAIFALQDGSGDNVVTVGNATDKIVEIWQQGQYGVSSYSDSQYGGEDLEIAVKYDGKRTLFFNDYQGNVYALDLADNGLALSGNGKTVLTGAAGPGGYNMGFELDMNFIPEPGTMLLIGTGMVSLFGVVRRRRMK